jgi:hypothetical protein
LRKRPLEESELWSLDGRSDAPLGHDDRDIAPHIELALWVGGRYLYARIAQTFTQGDAEDGVRSCGVSTREIKAEI